MQNAFSRRAAAVLALLAFANPSAYAHHVPAKAVVNPDDASVSNGKMIAASPEGVSASVGSLPVNAIADVSGRYALVTGSGFREQLSSVDLSTGKLCGLLKFDRAPGADPSNGLFYGLAETGNTIYASQGAASRIAVATIAPDGSLTAQKPIAAQPGDLIAGLSADARGNLYAVVRQYDDTSSDLDPANMTAPGSLAIFSQSSGRQIGRIALTGDAVPLAATAITPTSYPFAAATLADGTKTFVTSQRDGLVYVVDTFDPTRPKLLGTIPVGKDPSTLLLSADGSALYVANADSDTISVVDTAGNVVLKTISLLPPAAQDLPGATPMGMALSADDKTLYVALGDMNAVGVVDLTTDAVTGYIPAGWYPTSVVLAGSKLLIVNGKGNVARIPNAPADPGPGAGIPSGGNFVLNIIEGTTQLIDTPSPIQLLADTQVVLRRNELARLALSSYGVLSHIGLASGKIKHVIYIIKENRTYDQILGDFGEGDGDPALAIFGKDVTPNQHALARRFVLLDNFYDSGDVSGDGWNWSTQGYATEYVARNIPYLYSGRGGQYDFEGQNNGYITGGFPALDPDGNLYSPLAPRGLPPIPNVADSAGGHIWDDALESKLTIRNYGFFLSDGIAGIIPDNYPDSPGLQPPGHDLSGNTDMDFRRFDLSYPDSNAPSHYYALTGDARVLRKTTRYGRAGSPSRYAEWAREFDMMLNADPSGSRVPNLMMVRFMCDHTSGAASGMPSPRSDVADNDAAVGELIEHVSHSAVWDSTAIFVIEDDAQNGEDHVDCHRSVCFIASPYVKQGAVDHSFYNTDSVLRTIEVLLGMKPMCQYDAVAQPIADFTSKPLNDAPYDCLLPDESIIAERNPSASALAPNDPRRKLAMESDGMDFSRADDVPTAELNAIVWQSVKGPGERDPTPQHHVIAVDGSALDAGSGALEGDD